MTTLLQLNSSIFSNGGQSSQLADEFVAAWRTAHRTASIIARDFARDPVPHLTAERFQSCVESKRLHASMVVHWRFVTAAQRGTLHIGALG